MQFFLLIIGMGVIFLICDLVKTAISLSPSGSFSHTVSSLKHLFKLPMLPLVWECTVILLFQMEAEHVYWNSTFAHHVRIVIPVQGQLLLLSSKLSKVSRKAENSFELYSGSITSEPNDGSHWVSPDVVFNLWLRLIFPKIFQWFVCTSLDRYFIFLLFVSRQASSYHRTWTWLGLWHSMAWFGLCVCVDMIMRMSLGKIG